MLVDERLLRGEGGLLRPAPRLTRCPFLPGRFLALPRRVSSALLPDCRLPRPSPRVRMIRPLARSWLIISRPATGVSCWSCHGRDGDDGGDGGNDDNGGDDGVGAAAKRHPGFQVIKCGEHLLMTQHYSEREQRDLRGFASKLSEHLTQIYQWCAQGTPWACLNPAVTPEIQSG